jgi:HK97 family phage major capsid protein
MPNRLLERLGADFSTMEQQYETILNRCADEARDPNEGEVGILDGLRSQMAPLGERIVELRQVDEARQATTAALQPLPELPAADGAGGTAVVQVRSEPELYRPDGDHFFFRDLFESQLAGDMEARDRLDRHNLQMRAAATSATGAGVMPPTWLVSEFAEIAHGSRPTADTLRRIPITDAKPVTIGLQLTGAVVGDQANENDPPADGAFTSNTLVTVPKTKTGKVDVSRQLLDGSNPAIDGLIFTDCMGAYAENIETMVWAAMNAMVGAGLAYNGTMDLVANATAQIPDAVVIAGTMVRTKRKSAPTVVFMSENLWGNTMLQKDTQGRPIVVSGWAGPANARGIGDALTYQHVAGQVAGLPVVPSWAGNNNLYVVKADDALLLESSTMNFRYEEVLGPESIRLGVWGYAAVVTDRYPKAWGKVAVTPPAGGLPLSTEVGGDADSDAEPQAEAEPKSGKASGGR